MKHVEWHVLGYASLVFVLLAPLGAADPEVLDVSEATVFVDGSVDTFEFSGQGTSGVGTSWTIRAPDGQSATVTHNGQSGPGSCTFKLNGEGSLSCTQTLGWLWEGDLSGAAADGTWTIQLAPNPQYHAYDEGSIFNRPGPTLSVAGRAIHYGVIGTVPATWNQAWNWHETVGVWNEPSMPTTTSAVHDDPVDEAPEEDPNNARYFIDPGSQEPPDLVPGDGSPIALTGGNTVTCQFDADIEGHWARGLTQTSDTITRFAWIQGTAPGDQDLRDNVGTITTTPDNQGSGVNGTESTVILYNNAAGNSYQFIARNGTGPETLGQVVVIAPGQCIPEPENPDLTDPNPDAITFTASQAQCNGDATSFTIIHDLAPSIIGDGFEMVIRTSDGTVVLIVPDNQWTELENEYYGVTRTLAPGTYHASITAFGSGIILGIDRVVGAESVSVPDINCIPPDLDLTAVLAAISELPTETDLMDITLTSAFDDWIPIIFFGGLLILLGRSNNLVLQLLFGPLFIVGAMLPFWETESPISLTFLVFIPCLLGWLWMMRYNWKLTKADTA